MVFAKPTLKLLRRLLALTFCNETLYDAVFGTMETFERITLTKMCISKFDPK